LFLWLRLWLSMDPLELIQRRIHPGMAKAEAKAVLGPPAEDYRITRSNGEFDHHLCWEFDEGRLYAQLDYNGKVLYTFTHPDTPTRRERLRHRLRAWWP